MSNATHNDGGPAFPRHYGTMSCGEKKEQLWSDGMTLRDYFAGRALVGWLSGPCAGDVMDDYLGDEKAFSEHLAAVSQNCYQYADAMLAAREENK
jgi:hypothetical protein